MNDLPYKGYGIKKWLLQNLEVLFWLAAIGLLFFMNEASSQPSLCFFNFIGFEHCPGCGLGRSIHYALHLNFMKSFDEHLFGVPAILIILFRIKQLSFNKKQQLYEKI